MDFPEGRGVYNGENQASGISPPEHTSALGPADRWLPAAQDTGRERAISRGPSDPQLWLLQEVEVMHSSFDY